MVIIFQYYSLQQKSGSYFYLNIICLISREMSNMSRKYQVQIYIYMFNEKHKLPKFRYVATYTPSHTHKRSGIVTSPLQNYSNCSLGNLEVTTEKHRIFTDL